MKLEIDVPDDPSNYVVLSKATLRAMVPQYSDALDAPGIVLILDGDPICAES